MTLRSIDGVWCVFVRIRIYICVCNACLSGGHLTRDAGADTVIVDFAMAALLLHSLVALFWAGRRTRLEWLAAGMWVCVCAVQSNADP